VVSLADSVAFVVSNLPIFVVTIPAEAFTVVFETGKFEALGQTLLHTHPDVHVGSADEGAGHGTVMTITIAADVCHRLDTIIFIFFGGVSDPVDLHDCTAAALLGPFSHTGKIAFAFVGFSILVVLAATTMTFVRKHDGGELVLSRCIQAFLNTSLRCYIKATHILFTDGQVKVVFVVAAQVIQIIAFLFTS